MAGRGSSKRRNASKVVIHRRQGTLTISQDGSTMTQYLFPRFANADEAQRYFEQAGYVVASERKSKVSLIKSEE
ncbi:MAG TPA: hypothetical protein VK003_20815 [Oceanobacillus sp.]|nr:hypothetical protein [Oceanobacillus sp.]